MLRETTLTISDSTDAVSSVESEIMRIVSLNTTEITEITRFKKPIVWVRIKKNNNKQ